MEDGFEHVLRLIFRTGYTRVGTSEEKGVYGCSKDAVLQKDRAVCNTAGRGAVEGLPKSSVVVRNVISRAC